MGWRDQVATAFGYLSEKIPWVRSQATAVLGLGSNVGDRLDALRSALEELDAAEGVEVIKVSSVYETEPDTGGRDLGDLEQGDFLNLVAVISTTLEPRELLALAHRIEAHHGRDRTSEVRWGPRTLDIDLLLFDDLEVADDDLTVPHPRLTERAFVLVPLAEVLPPGARLPDGTTISRRIVELAPITGVERYVRLTEGPGVDDEPLLRRPPGPQGGPPRLGPAQGGEEMGGRRSGPP